METLTMEEEIVRMIKRLLDERVSQHGVLLLNTSKAASIAVEMGLDAGCIKEVFDAINRMLEEKFKSRQMDNIP